MVDFSMVYVVHRLAKRLMLEAGVRNMLTSFVSIL